MNRVILCGRLTKDLEIRQSGDMSIAKFTLAVDRKVKKGEEKKADFINCTAFGNLATFAEKYFHKGDGMSLEGRIQTGSYKNREGQTIYTTDVIADAIEFPVGGKSSSGNNSGNDANSNPASNDGFMNLPEGIDEELPFQ